MLNDLLEEGEGSLVRFGVFDSMIDSELGELDLEVKNPILISLL
jgi:hypothetical protein